MERGSVDQANISIFIAVAALGVAVYTALRNASLQKDQVRLQERVTDIEEARRGDEIAARLVAEVTAKFESYISKAGSQAYKFVLLNQGPARAENVTFEVLKPAVGVPPSIRMEGHNFPVSLDRNHEYEMACTVLLATAPSVEVILHWTDGRGKQDKSLLLTVHV
jgi:hypothetical protein